MCNQTSRLIPRTEKEKSSHYMLRTIKKPDQGLYFGAPKLCRSERPGDYGLCYSGHLLGSRALPRRPDFPNHSLAVWLTTDRCVYPVAQIWP